MSSASRCFFTCKQVTQKTCKVVWYSYVFKNFPQFVVIHTVKGFSIVNEAEVDDFLEFPCLCYMMQQMLAIWSLVPLAFLNPTYTSGSSQFTYCWSLAWSILNITLLACEMRAIAGQFEHSLALPIFGIAMKSDLSQSCGHYWENITPQRNSRLFPFCLLQMTLGEKLCCISRCRQGCAHRCQEIKI